MIIVGLTGGIASGKSTVSSILAELGATIIDADKIASTVVMPKQPAWYEIVAHFGREILLSDDTINRKMLGEKIFTNKAERECLEKITHPYIEEKVQQSITEAKRLGNTIVVLDVPLLFESGWNKTVDEVWVVYVDAETQVARLVARNQFTPKQAMDRINAQMNLTEKVKQANIVIDNNLDFEHVRKQVSIVWEELWQRSQRSCM